MIPLVGADFFVTPKGGIYQVIPATFQPYRRPPTKARRRTLEEMVGSAFAPWLARQYVQQHYGRQRHALDSP